MSISISDPLALVAIQAGQVGTPASEGAAAGASQLDTQQRSVEIGEPVPIAFGRWRSIGGINAGGVLVSPGATECRFENDANNNVTAYYHLVISEGEIDSIPVKDVFQRSCRVGSHTQTYSRRAGAWIPANAIQARVGYEKPEASYYCGSIGAYPGMSTLSFEITIPNGFDQWNRQVHCFIRGGMHVNRLYDNINGPSDNFADLVYWMLTSTGQVPNSLIDTSALSAAAEFLEVNGFTCNCWITKSVNYADLLAQWAPYFMLCESNVNGKRGLRPVLPTTAAGEIDTGVITPVWTFTEDYITPGSFEVEYLSLAARRPFVAQMIWRQQLEDDFGIIRTAEVRYAGTAETGPYESHDLSEFCTTENHAVKIGAYILSKRVQTSHTIRFSAGPQAHNTLVRAGSIIRVRLTRQASVSGVTYHDYLYHVERITKTLDGELSYECTHFPVNADGASLIAIDVAGASGTGILLGSNKTGVSCDINSPTDNTIPDETWSDPDFGYGDYPDWEWDDTNNEWTPTPPPDNPNWEWDDTNDEWTPTPPPDNPNWEWDDTNNEWTPTPPPDNPNWEWDDTNDEWVPTDPEDPNLGDPPDLPGDPPDLPGDPPDLPGDPPQDGLNPALSAPSLGGTTIDLVGSGSNDGDGEADESYEDDNAEDDKDREQGDPYDSWPPGYPTPDDPDWPFDPTDGDGSITPIDPDDGWSPEDPVDGRYQILTATGGSAAFYVKSNGQCRGPYAQPAGGTSRYYLTPNSGKKFVGMFKERGPSGECGGREYAVSHVVIRRPDGSLYTFAAGFYWSAGEAGGEGDSANLSISFGTGEDAKGATSLDG